MAHMDREGREEEERGTRHEQNNKVLLEREKRAVDAFVSISGGGDDDQ